MLLAVKDRVKAIVGSYCLQDAQGIHTVTRALQIFSIGREMLRGCNGRARPGIDAFVPLAAPAEAAYIVDT